MLLLYPTELRNRFCGDRNTTFFGLIKQKSHDISFRPKSALLMSRLWISVCNHFLSRSIFVLYDVECLQWSFLIAGLLCLLHNVWLGGVLALASTSIDEQKADGNQQCENENYGSEAYNRRAEVFAVGVDLVEQARSIPYCRHQREVSHCK